MWQKAVGFAGAVYRITGGFPAAERFGLTTQLRRAAVSVAANIAEGASRTSGKDQARFFEMAYGSLNEVVTMFHIAAGQGFIQAEVLTDIRSEAARTCRMLSGLRRAAQGRQSLNPQP